MIFISVLLLLACTGVTIGMGCRLVKAKRDNEQLRAMVNNQDAYVFLVDPDLRVLKTNYYVRQQKIPGGHNILGNLLHCKNAHDAEVCGKHDACKKCPVRFVIKKSFEHKSGFRDLEACMEQLGDDNRINDIDVQIDGRFVKMGREGNLVVNVRKAHQGYQPELPKLLFISENVALYNRVREALGGKVRVLGADNLHQALHRLLMLSSYRFLAVLTDDTFYSKNGEVTKLLVKSDAIKVIVFTSKDCGDTDGHVLYLKEDFDPQRLQFLLLQKKGV